MTARRLDQILSRLAEAAVAVVGDFFLDKYLEIDPALSETSLETGLEARQVVAVRCQPGAAGTIAANLCALGIDRVICIGFVGDDGEGFELLRGLRELGADADRILARADRFTPTYRKPLVRHPDGRVRELERLDTEHREPLPPNLEESLITAVREVAPEVKAVIAQDQVQEPECGVITSGMRQALAELAEQHPNVVWFGDSRFRIGEYRNLIVKPNRQEVCRAIHPDTPAHDSAGAKNCAAIVSAQVGRPVYLTLGADGMALITPDEAQPIPTARPEGELDIVGAGDSATAGIVSALCGGATLEEAGVLGNIVASITVQQIGTTGTATQDQVRQQFARHTEVWRELPRRG
ncbi:MAG: carbohydrate kinase [Armatimonadota bacterium]|nr:MAG: carbohydrate kinase [Armatimonadota bacterium]